MLKSCMVRCKLVLQNILMMRLRVSSLFYCATFFRAHIALIWLVNQWKIQNYHLHIAMQGILYDSLTFNIFLELIDWLPRNLKIIWFWGNLASIYMWFVILKTLVSLNLMDKNDHFSSPSNLTLKTKKFWKYQRAKTLFTILKALKLYFTMHLWNFKWYK